MSTRATAVSEHRLRSLQGDNKHCPQGVGANTCPGALFYGEIFLATDLLYADCATIR